MADLISEIISQEALDQIRTLKNELKEVYDQMESLIVVTAKYNGTNTGNSVKETTAAVEKYNVAVEQLKV